MGDLSIESFLENSKSEEAKDLGTKINDKMKSKISTPEGLKGACYNESYIGPKYVFGFLKSMSAKIFHKGGETFYVDSKRTVFDNLNSRGSEEDRKLTKEEKEEIEEKWNKKIRRNIVLHLCLILFVSWLLWLVWYAIARGIYGRDEKKKILERENNSGESYSRSSESIGGVFGKITGAFKSLGPKGVNDKKVPILIGSNAPSKVVSGDNSSKAKKFFNNLVNHGSQLQAVAQSEKAGAQQINVLCASGKYFGAPLSDIYMDFVKFSSILSAAYMKLRKSDPIVSFKSISTGGGLGLPKQYGGKFARYTATDPTATMQTLKLLYGCTPQGRSVSVAQYAGMFNLKEFQVYVEYPKKANKIAEEKIFKGMTTYRTYGEFCSLAGIKPEQYVQSHAKELQAIYDQYGNKAKNDKKPKIEGNIDHLYSTFFDIVLRYVIIESRAIRRVAYGSFSWVTDMYQSELEYTASNLYDIVKRFGGK